MTKAGFVALAFGQMFRDESDGTPRGTVLPDLYEESSVEVEGCLILGRLLGSIEENRNMGQPSK